MLLHDLQNRGLIRPPDFLADNTHYLTVMGSIAYGVSTDTSDFDVYGFCIPPKNLVFPHLGGEIPGFGRQIKRFEQYQQHHIKDPSAQGGKGREYDFTVYSIVKFFQLCMENNPNMVDALFTPQNAVLHMTELGNKVRENRRIFLHKSAWHKFKGYAYAQVHKMKSQTREGKRKKVVEEHGYDIKFAYHVVRLMNEIEQIMMEGDLDLQRNREQLKSIRRGEWTLEQVMEYFESKERKLETLYTTSDLPHGPDEDKIKTLLLECLEMHYGNLDKAVVIPGEAERILEGVRRLVNK